MSEPLPPGIHTGNADFRLRPFSCPECGVTLHAHDIEELPDAGYELICKCGTELLSIIHVEEMSNAGDC